MWINQMRSKPIHTQPESRQDRLSFVYSIDVSNLCIKFLQQSADKNFISKVHGQSYNIAFEEHPTLDQLITLIASSEFSNFRRAQRATPQ